MQTKTCNNCKELKRCQESRASLLFFIIGMIATIAIRAVTVLAHLNPIYGEIAWYIGVFGFFIFFVYKYKVDQARYRLIVQRKLMDTVAEGKTISDDDRELIGSILCALSSNKDRINYFLIFVSSALAILIAVYFDFMKR
ncbi:MAG: hypothetical protein KBA46_03280 [Candidatus Omnitrophica bacterium]|nr:hypothetical protein [Candidatus Omnitrophota bacterium]